MGAPFHFPTEYGKLGNWPGSLGAVQAQTLLMEAVTHGRDERFVELGFDGGRTTIVLSWAAREVGARVDSTAVRHDETGLWFRRAHVVFKMSERVQGHEALAPFPADLIVINPSVPISLNEVGEWLRLANNGASIVRIGPDDVGELGTFKRTITSPGVNVWKKLTDGGAMERAIENVVSEFSENKRVHLDSNQHAKIRSLRGGKERIRVGGGARS